MPEHRRELSERHRPNFEPRRHMLERRRAFFDGRVANLDPPALNSAAAPPDSDPPARFILRPCKGFGRGLPDSAMCRQDPGLVGP